MEEASEASEAVRCRCMRATEDAVVWSTWIWEMGWRLEWESYNSVGRRRRMAGAVVGVSLDYYVYVKEGGKDVL